MQNLSPRLAHRPASAGNTHLTHTHTHAHSKGATLHRTRTRDHAEVEGSRSEGPGRFIPCVRAQSYAPSVFATAQVLGSSLREGLSARLLAPTVLACMRDSSADGHGGMWLIDLRRAVHKELTAACSVHGSVVSRAARRYVIVPPQAFYRCLLQGLSIRPGARGYMHMKNGSIPAAEHRSRRVHIS